MYYPRQVEPANDELFEYTMQVFRVTGSLLDRVVSVRRRSVANCHRRSGRTGFADCEERIQERDRDRGEIQ